MGNRKQPNPPPAGAVKPDPPPAPPVKRRAPWPPPPKPWPKAPPPKVKPPREAPPIDCKSAEGITIGLVDALMTVSRVLAERLARQPLTDSEREALTDLRSDRDLTAVLNAARPWTYCSDLQPEEAERYEVAYLTRGGERSASSWFELPSDQGWSVPNVYAWRPIVEDPPPLRPEDRTYLIDNGVPPEWLEPKGDL